MAEQTTEEFTLPSFKDERSNDDDGDGSRTVGNLEAGEVGVAGIYGIREVEDRRFSVGLQSALR